MAGDRPAKMGKTRIPHERATAPRSDLLKTYRQALKAGWIDEPENEGAFFEELFASYGGQASPKDGWSILAVELRLIELALSARANLDTPGRAKIAENCKKYADDLWGLYGSISNLTHEWEFLGVLLHLKINTSFPEHLRALMALKLELESAAKQLESMAQPTKWKSTQNKQVRVELAVRLIPLFEEQFGQQAKPLGGSASLDIRETNDWTRFFQMAAKAFWDEAATPDRQAVLRKALLPTAW